MKVARQYIAPKTWRPVQGCQWFALCDRPATGTTPHPILGEVPTCDRCHQFATGAPRKREAE